MQNRYMEVIRLIPPWIRHRVPRFIKDWLRTRWWNAPTPIYDVGEPSPSSHLKLTYRPKRVLLSYITTPFRLSLDDPRNVMFSNIGIARSIARVLNELGYIVDIVEWTDTKFLPCRYYDLFIGHGGCNFEHIARHLPAEMVKVYFSTGLYWKEHNRREEERFRWLEERRGVRLPYDRWIHYSEEYANQTVDGIICLGNKIARESYSKFPLVFNLNNASYPDDCYDRTVKDFASARNNFLFFAGGGNVHKGLDLLLEVFPMVDAHLWVCQRVRPNFFEVYRREFESCKNIHLLGRIAMRGQLFYKLVDKCAYIILPSCSEGCAGSVVECMHHGLIPVVSLESTVETGNYGVAFNTCSIEEIKEVVQDLSHRPPEWCKEVSMRTMQAALTQFSEENFLRNMKNAIQDIVQIKRK